MKGDGKEATLSEDGTTITWKIPARSQPGEQFPNDNGPVETVTIKGIKANASTVGDGEDVTAVVSVQRCGGSQRFAQTRGRDNRSRHQGTASNVLQCEASDTEGGTATITIQEAGFASSIGDMQTNLWCLSSGFPRV